MAGGLVTLSLIASIVYQVTRRAARPPLPKTGEAKAVNGPNFECNDLQKSKPPSPVFVSVEDLTSVRQPPRTCATVNELRKLLGRRSASLTDDAIKNLVALDLAGHQLSCVHPVLGAMRQLRMLYLPNNQLTDFPEGAPYLATLEELDLSYNSQLRLTDAIVEMRALKRLNLTACQLIRLPATINQLVNLEELRLAYNLIIELPDLSHLVNVQLLDLSFNVGLHNIPDWVGSLRKLRSLNLRHCSALHELPIALLSQLQELQEIDIEGTNILAWQKTRILSACHDLRLRAAVAVVVPGSSVGREVSLWKHRASRETEKWDGHLAGDPEQLDRISAWLRRLTNTQEFHLHAETFAKTVCDVLKTAYLQPDFFNYMLGIAAGDLEGCGDRAGSSFGEVYVEWLIRSIAEDAPILEVVKIIIAHKHQKLLRKLVGEAAECERQRLLAAARRDNPDLQDGAVQLFEMAEVYIWAELECKDALSLKLPYASMLYARLGCPLWIRTALPGIRTEILQHDNAELLNDETAWRSYLQKQRAYQWSTQCFEVLQGFATECLEITWDSVKPLSEVEIAAILAATPLSAAESTAAIGRSLRPGQVVPPRLLSAAEVAAAIQARPLSVEAIDAAMRGAPLQIVRRPTPQEAIRAQCKAAFAVWKEDAGRNKTLEPYLTEVVANWEARWQGIEVDGSATFLSKLVPHARNGLFIELTHLILRPVD